MRNKKAQGLSTNTIILLILGIMVLVFLIIGFSVGFGKLAPFLSKNNVDSIATSCEISCNTGATASFAFCFQVRDLKADDVELNKVTCNYLAEKQTKYGIEQCPAISCNAVFVDLLDGESLEGKCADNLGKTVQVLVGDTLESVDC